MMYFLSKAAAFIILPPGIFIVLITTAFILILCRKRRPAAFILGASLLFLYLASARFFSDMLIRPLEDRYPALDPAALEKIEVEAPEAPVVVLSGGSIELSPDDGMHASLNTESIKRLVYGLELARRLDRSLIFTGGTSGQDDGNQTAGESEADAARRFIRQNPALLAGRNGRSIQVRYEDKSRTTRENARNVAGMPGGNPKVILVTSAYHMRRAVLSFNKAGVVALPAPADYKSKRTPPIPSDFLPTIAAFLNTYRALREYIGYIAYSAAR